MSQHPAASHPQPSLLATQVAAATQVAVSDGIALPHILTTSSDFLRFKERQTLFVDKTALLQELVDLGRVFLARPKCFGKTLLISLLEELFTHGTQHFEHLAIADIWHEQQYQVLKLSFLHLRDPATFEQELCTELRAACDHAGFHEIYDFIPECHDFAILFTRVTCEVLKDQQVVVLIDDWDAPLTSNLHDQASFEANSKHLFAVYKLLRECESIWFLLITGTARYHTSSLHTGDNITNISIDNNFAALVGYTEEELRTYFAPYLARSAALYHLSEEALLEKIRDYYGSFCFDELGQVRVYNPCDINRFFAQVAQDPNNAPLFKPFWLQESAVPRTIMSALRDYQPDLTCLEQLKTEGIKLVHYDISAAYHYDDMSLVKFLLQTGFLTIKEKLDDCQETELVDLFEYRCNFTNVEVEKFFIELVMSYVTDQEEDNLSSGIKTYAQHLISGLKAHDMERAVHAINAMLSCVHYDLQPAQSREVFYRVLIALFLQIKLDPPHVRQEVGNNIGRSDIEALIGNDLFVFELKLIPIKKKKSKHSADSTAGEQAQAAQDDDINLDPPSLATQTRIALNAFDQIIGNSYGSASFSRVVEHWYGVVLVISEATRQICYWRYFTTNQELGCGAVEPISINNLPQVTTE